jgi:hypothetical protein
VRNQELYNEMWQELQERERPLIERLTGQGIELTLLKSLFEDITDKMLNANI